MISFEEAKQRVLDYVGVLNQGNAHRLVLSEQERTETKYAWVFFLTGEKYLQTRQFRDMLIGMGPVLVDKADGKLHVFGSAMQLTRIAPVYDRLRSIGDTDAAEVQRVVLDEERKAFRERKRRERT